MENKDDTKKKSSWSIPAIIFFVVIVILIPMIRNGIDTNEIKSSNSNNNILSSPEYNDESIDSAIVTGSDSSKYIFSFNKATISKFEGSKMVASQDSIMSGYIILKRDKLRIDTPYSLEDFIIKGFKKTSNGGYVFETVTEAKESCMVSILNNSGKELVVLHYPEIQVMIYLFINKGFTLDLKLFSDSDQ